MEPSKNYLLSGALRRDLKEFETLIRIDTYTNMINMYADTVVNKEDRLYSSSISAGERLELKIQIDYLRQLIIWLKDEVSVE